MYVHVCMCSRVAYTAYSRHAPARAGLTLTGKKRGAINGQINVILMAISLILGEIKPESIEKQEKVIKMTLIRLLITPLFYQ